MVVDHDVHVHTLLSACCTDEALNPRRAVAEAARLGLATIGFADHLWDSRVPGASRWYRPQDLRHVQRIRAQIPRRTDGVRVLIGCESEYCGGGKVGISPDVAQLFDFVLLPMSHFHMSGDFVRPKGVTSPKSLAGLLVERFKEVVGTGLATGIAHPFLPCGFTDRCDEILALISDAELEECFGLAAEARVSIEVNTGMFPGCRGGQMTGFHDESFLRVLSVAKQAGCLFHFGSDAHRLDQIENVLALGPYAEASGIAPPDIHPLFRADGAPHDCG